MQEILRAPTGISRTELAGLVGGEQNIPRAFARGVMVPGVGQKGENSQTVNPSEATRDTILK